MIILVELLLELIEKELLGRGTRIFLRARGRAVLKRLLNETTQVSDVCSTSKRGNLLKKKRKRIVKPVELKEKVLDQKKKKQIKG